MSGSANISEFVLYRTVLRSSHHISPQFASPFPQRIDQGFEDTPVHYRSLAAIQPKAPRLQGSQVHQMPVCSTDKGRINDFQYVFEGPKFRTSSDLSKMSLDIGIPVSRTFLCHDYRCIGVDLELPVCVVVDGDGIAVTPSVRQKRLILVPLGAFRRPPQAERSREVEKQNHA
jgi:hypothetical protein